MHMKITVRIPLTFNWLSKLMRIGTPNIDANVTGTLLVKDKNHRAILVSNLFKVGTSQDPEFYYN